MHLFTASRLGMALLCTWLLTAQSFAQTTAPFSYTSDARDTLGRQREDEFRRLIDPTTGTVPVDRLAQEQERISKMKKLGSLGTTSAIPGITWQERGPSNVGGRTRAVLFDPNDASHKKVWVGSPSGGLWYTNDITDANATWKPVSDGWENVNVSCLVADPVNPQVMYAGTGSYYSSGVSLNGGGIWKTTDGGSTWNRLTNTIPGGNYGSVSSSFGFIQRLVVNNAGHIFAATRYGVVRSTDGGVTWQFGLAPSQAIGISGTATNNYFYDMVSDLEVGSDGILFAAFDPSRVFRSTNAAGTVWTEITPSGEPINEGRTELALAPTTSGTGQVVYAVAKYYGATYNQDVKWFKKSNNAGTSWVSVTIPTHSWGGYFTNGNGNSALNLSVDPTNSTVLYAGSYDWFRSVDGGATWSGDLTSGYVLQQGLAFQPGSSSAIVTVSDRGVNFTTGWGTASTSTMPAILDRNLGYRIGDIGSVSMKPGPGGSYALFTSYGLGPAVLSSSGLGAGSPIFGSGYNGPTFIDNSEPNLQLFHAYGSFYRYDGSTSTQLFSANGYNGGAYSDYDSQNNKLYLNEYITGSPSYYAIRRVTGIGSTISSSSFTVPDQPNYLKLGTGQTTLYVSYYNSLLVRYTNLNQTTPTATTIASGSTLPPYSYISCIDVGSTDNELLVTLSNYGVASVWYTNNGGATWVNKDAAGSGLPDVPVRAGMFNPQNRQQVILGTDLGIWTTNDISATNPGWTLSSTGMGLLKINQLRYRPSDGRLVAATTGRGIFETNALAVPYTPSSVSITSTSNATLCTGSTMAVSFSTTGQAFADANSYEVWVSDAAGNFASQRRIGTGTSSPMSVTLPTGTSALAYGTGYRLRIVAVDAELTSPASSQSLTIGDMTTAAITDRRTTPWSTSSYAEICLGDQVRLGLKASNVAGGITPVDAYQWVFNNTAVGGATSSTYLAGQAGYYKVRLRQAGCTVESSAYSVYINPSTSAYVNSRFGNLPQCDDTPVLLVSSYAGELASVQWMRNGAAIAGAISSTYSALQSGSYMARVDVGGCSVYNNALTLTLGRSLIANLKLPASADSLLCAGNYTGNVNLYTDNISPPQIGPDGYSVVWYRNNVPTTQFRNQFYLSATQPGSYSYELQQGTCRVRSNAVVVKQSTLIQPIIDTYNVPKSACPGDTRTLYLFQSYSSLQWQKDGVDIPNATGPSYVAQSTGNYTIRAIKGSCSAISPPVSLTFSNALIPEINGQNMTESCVNRWLDVRECAKLSGTQIQWIKDGVPIPGETTANLNTTVTGLYSVSVTNGACSGLSKPVLSKPYTGTKPTVNAVRATCANGAVRLTASQLQYNIQWKRSGVAIPDETSYNYYPTQSGFYSVSTDGYCGAYESDLVEVKIGEFTSAMVTGNVLVNAGQSVQLPVVFTGPAPWSFTLNNGQAVQNTYQNPYPLAVAATATSTYSVVSIENACGTGTAMGQATVTVGSGQADVSLGAQVSSRTPRVNDIVTYSLLITNTGPQNADNVKISSRLPAGVDFVDTQSPEVSAANGLVSGNVGTVMVGNTVIVNYRLRITQPGVFFTAAQITNTSTPDPDSQPNSGTGDGQDDATSVDLRTVDAEGILVVSANPNQMPLPGVSIDQPPVSLTAVDLSLAMRSSTLTPQAGDVVSLSLTVGNSGGATANNVVVQILLPAGWQLTSSTGFAVSGQTIRAYVNQLTPNGQTVLVLPVQVSAGSGLVQAQIVDVAEPVGNTRPGNGYQNGERDEAGLLVRVR